MQMSSSWGHAFLFVAANLLSVLLAAETRGCKVDFAPAKKKKRRRKKKEKKKFLFFQLPKVKISLQSTHLRHAEHALCRHKTMQLAGVGSYHPGTQTFKKKANLNGAVSTKRVQIFGGKPLFHTFKFNVALLLGTGSPEHPPRLSHSFRALPQLTFLFSLLLYVHRHHEDY